MNKGRKGNSSDKPKDFKASFKKLMTYNKPFIVLVCIALILSMASSVLSK